MQLYNRGIHVDNDGARQDVHEASPLQHRHRAFGPVSKRRKVSHPGAGGIEPITASSPAEDNALSPQLDFDSSASQSDLDDDFGQSLRPPINEESARLARFRPIASVLTQSSPVSRTIFKAISEDNAEKPLISNSVLPDVFSPSRRRGKKDYVPGGNADLVRSWVLGITAQESQSQSRSEQTLALHDVCHDSSGRFTTVTDENGSRWLLPEQQEKAGTGGKFSCSDLHPGARIRLKGQATKWALVLDSPDLKDITVAAYWEIVSA